MEKLFEAVKNDIAMSEFVVGSYVQYPNLLSQDDRCHVGKIIDTCTNGMQDFISIENDRNQELTPSSVPTYSMKDLKPVLLTERWLVNHFKFEKKENEPLYGLPLGTTYYELKLEKDTVLRVIEKCTAMFCLVIESDTYFGCTFIPIIYVHRLQNILSEAMS